MPGLHWIDLLVIVLYLVGTTFIGAWAARKIRGMGDFFMPRRFGKVMLTTHAFGTGTHSDQAVSVAAKSFSSGLSGIWYQWLWLFATPFYWLIAPMMRRFRAITMADVFTARFGRSVGVLFAVIGAVQLSFNIGVMLKGSSAVISACFGDQVSPDLVIAVMTVLFVVYGVAGGLAAAIVTDFVQGILTVVFSFVLLPSVLRSVGGMSGLRETITDPGMFSLVAPGGIGVFYIAVISLNALVGIVTQPHTMGACAAGRTEADGRFGFTVGNFIKRLCTMAWCVTGLAALAHLGADIHPDRVYGMMAREFLPMIAPGLLGVFLAALLASVMSSCDSFMIASSALVTENVYRPLVKARSATHYLWAGRLVAVIIVFGGVFAAYWLESVVQGLEIFWKLAPMLGIAFWMGLFWRRMTTAGAWASTLAAFAAWWMTGQAFFIERVPVYMTTGSGDTLALSLPWQMICYLVVGFVAGVLVSLVTKPESDQRMDSFFELVRTPVGKEEGEPSEPCTLPAGTVPAEKRLLVDLVGIQVPVPARSTVIGFVLCWVAVGALIAGFYAVTR